MKIISLQHLNKKEIQVSSGVLTRIYKRLEVNECAEAFQFGEVESENYDFTIYKDDIKSYTNDRGLEVIKLRTGESVSFIKWWETYRVSGSDTKGLIFQKGYQFFFLRSRSI